LSSLRKRGEGIGARKKAAYLNGEGEGANPNLGRKKVSSFLQLGRITWEEKKKASTTRKALSYPRLMEKVSGS